jgi:hypothetical protein
VYGTVKTGAESQRKNGNGKERRQLIKMKKSENFLMKGNPSVKRGNRRGVDVPILDEYVLPECGCGCECAY